MEDDGVITTASGTQYLRPDYLEPVSSPVDAKKSPLALLAQTCSQIGADPPPSASKSPSTSSSSSRRDERRSNGNPSPRSCFRPYEDDSTTKKVKASPGPKPGFHPYLSSRSKPEPCRDSCADCPYVCSWVGPSSSPLEVAFCGARFSTADSLLAHLRAHAEPLHPLLRAPGPMAPLTPLARLYPGLHKGPLPPTLLPPPLPYPLPLPYPPYLYPPTLSAPHP